MHLFVCTKPSAVVAEQYDEIVFCDPSDKFSKQLMQYCVRKGSKASSSDPAQVISHHIFPHFISLLLCNCHYHNQFIYLTCQCIMNQEGVLYNAVFDDAQDLERLGGIHQHILSEIEGTI